MTNSCIDNVYAYGVQTPADIYNLQGIVVKRKTTDLSGLPAGIYIIAGKKIQVK